MNLSVVVFRRPNMFKVNENMYHMIGFGELEKLFTIEGYKTTSKSLTLYYPERFLNIMEQRVLLERIESAGFKDVQIATQSTFIIQTTPRDCCKIAVVEPEGFSMGAGDFKLSVDNVGMPDDSGLNVLGF